MTDVNKILDEFNLEVDEMEKQRRSKGNILRQQEECLVESGNKIRNMEVARQGTGDIQVQ